MQSCIMKRRSRLDAFCIPDNFVNSAAYWKAELLDVQAILSRKHFLSLFITITLDECSRNLGRLCLDVLDCTGIMPRLAADMVRMFDRPDITAIF